MASRSKAGNMHYTTQPDGYLEPKLGNCPFSSVAPKTIVEVFQDNVARFGKRPAMGLKRLVNDVKPKDWTIWTWEMYYDDCSKFAKSLLKLGKYTEGKGRTSRVQLGREERPDVYSLYSHKIRPFSSFASTN